MGDATCVPKLLRPSPVLLHGAFLAFSVHPIEGISQLTKDEPGLTTKQGANQDEISLMKDVQMQLHSRIVSLEKKLGITPGDPPPYS